MKCATFPAGTDTDLSQQLQTEEVYSNKKRWEVWHESTLLHQ